MKVAKAEFLTSATKPSEYPAVGPPEIALAGRSNVGKSSAINTLTLRKGLAVTSRTPGRTRLLNFFDLELLSASGKTRFPVRFVDLPGYGFANVPKKERLEWRDRVETYLNGRDTLKAVIHLVDVRHDASPLDIEMSEWLRDIGRHELLVFTKADKLSRNQRMTQARILEKAMGIPVGQGLLFSAHDSTGRDEVWKAIDALIR